MTGVQTCALPILPEGSVDAFRAQMTELSAGSVEAVELGEVFRGMPLEG